jgi:hypothetical protein
MSMDGNQEESRGSHDSNVTRRPPLSPSKDLPAQEYLLLYRKAARRFEEEGGKASTRKRTEACTTEAGSEECSRKI